jgi:hypothetical protein
MPQCFNLWLLAHQCDDNQTSMGNGAANHRVSGCSEVYRRTLMVLHVVVWAAQ